MHTTLNRRPIVAAVGSAGLPRAVPRKQLAVTPPSALIPPRAPQPGTARLKLPSPNLAQARAAPCGVRPANLVATPMARAHQTQPCLKPAAPANAARALPPPGAQGRGPASPNLPLQRAATGPASKTFQLPPSPPGFGAASARPPPAPAAQQRANKVHAPSASGGAMAHQRPIQTPAERMGVRAAAPGHGPQSTLQLRSARPAAPAAAMPPFAPPAVPPRLAKLIQRHQLLGPAKVIANAPRKRPWGGYPYAIVGAEPFNAQAAAAGVGGNDEFLTAAGANTANIVAANPGGLSLRLSNNADMAIEDSNLLARQPKVFYATAALVTEGNRLLAQAGSRITLHTGAASITIWTGWWAQKTLLRVTPQFNHANHVEPDLLPQNCNAVAAHVTGWSADFMVSRGCAAGARTAARLAPTAWNAYRTAFSGPGDLEAESNELAREYVAATTARPRAIEAARANRYARPEVGEAYVTTTMGHGTPVTATASRVHDYRSGQDRVLGWSFHFGGVVARSGSDRVTLENYARGDGRANGADPRWYFQMYGEQTGQSFHEVSEASANFANPVTVAVNRNTDVLPLQRPDA